MSDRDTTRALMEQLERHYLHPNDRLPAGVFLPEVSWNGYGGATSRCDALFVGFTSASGRLLVGHEVKASRSDWLTELRKVGKADDWADQCHQWWLVTVPGVVAEGELPAGWGLMLPGARNRMKIVTPAVTHTDLVPSWDASRSVIARLNTLHRNSIGASLAQGRAEQEAEFKDRVEREVTHRLRDIHGSEELQVLLGRYEKALGGKLVEPGERAYGNHFTEEDLHAAAAWLAVRRDVQSTGVNVARHYQLNGLRQTIERANATLQQLLALEQQCQQLGADMGHVA